MEKPKILTEGGKDEQGKQTEGVKDGQDNEVNQDNQQQPEKQQEVQEQLPSAPTENQEVQKLDPQNKIPTGSECKCCCNEIGEENYVFYRDHKDGELIFCNYCDECITYLLENSWETYVKAVDKADCLAALKRLRELGPPINLREQGVPCNNESKEIYELYYKNSIQSAKLKNSLTGIEREKYWDVIKEKYRLLGENELTHEQLEKFS